MNSLLKKIKLIFTIRCQHASQLASDALDRDLAWYERWAVRGHLLVCWSCRQFSRQIGFLGSAFRKSQENESNEGASGPNEAGCSVQLSPQKKDRLKAITVEQED